MLHLLSFAFFSSKKEPEPEPTLLEQMLGPIQKLATENGVDASIEMVGIAIAATSVMITLV